MISEKLKEQLGDWTCLYPFFESPEWAKIKESIKPDFSKTTPELDVWFKAFKECKFSALKVVFLGLSPYFTKDSYTKENVADGLAFSTSTRNNVPASLFQLYKGLEWDLWKGMNLNMGRTNNLTFLANQGVLLLNSALTTTYGKPDTHLEIWRPFIDFVFKVLTEQKPDVIVVAFGKVAQEVVVSNFKSEFIIQVEHPAASAYQSRNWEHSNMFSKINKVLEERNTPIVWDEYYLTLEPAPF